jgi:hypothetical protein
LTANDQMAPSIFVFEMIFQSEEKDSKPPTIAATAAAIPTMMRGIRNHRSWMGSTSTRSISYCEGTTVLN